MNAIKGILISQSFLKNGDQCPRSQSSARILVIIPVLREQNVIENTLDHFLKLDLKNIKLSVVLAGTVREKIEHKNLTNRLTRDVILQWMEKYHKKNAIDPDITFEYTESEDPGGDRASQITFAIEQYKSKKGVQIDIIGVYDADSLPGSKTLEEVLALFDAGADCCQQPVYFNMAVSKVSQSGGNPVVVANGLYQTTWTMIRELPRWIENSKSNKNYSRNLYIIGHGEFVAPKIYEKFGFPSDDVTDGIQLGYRLGMCQVKIHPLRIFCNDDIPKSIQHIIYQHKRWFGGCMRLTSAYNWVKKNGTISISSIAQFVDGYWSQMSWAFAAPIALLAVILSLILDDSIASRIVQIMIIISSCSGSAL